VFTGLIEEVGKVKTVKPQGGGYRISFTINKIGDDLKIDDSVAINGVCQTVIACSENHFEVVAVEETVRKTNFSDLRAGDDVNLERALGISDRLGGHFVQGHIDCKGKISSIQKERTGINVWISYPSKFSKYLVNTGSICVNGVSLTTARVEKDRFMVAVIPHTWNNTTFRNMRQGENINLEFDILGKYIEKLIKDSETNPNDKKKSILDNFLDQPEY